MSSRPQLEASESSDFAEATRLRREIVGLERELAEARDEAQKAKQASADAIHAIRALRKTLDPMYTAMKMIFGEISRVDASAAAADGGAPTRTGESLWRERAAKVGGGKARILEVLAEGGGQMSITQIRSAAHTGGNTSTYLNDLSSRNWVENVGRGVWALK
jgi:hypothetical protein